MSLKSIVDTAILHQTSVMLIHQTTCQQTTNSPQKTKYLIYVIFYISPFAVYFEGYITW